MSTVFILVILVLISVVIILQKQSSYIFTAEELLATSPKCHNLVTLDSKAFNSSTSKYGIIFFLVLELSLAVVKLTNNLPLDIYVVLSLLIATIFFLSLKLKSSKNNNSLDREISYYLPLVMEQVVMAVTAGHDVYSAISTVVNLNYDESTCSYTNQVLLFLHQVLEINNQGVPLSEAFKTVADWVKNASLNHAFIHLSAAHTEGGSIIAPLRELSDSVSLLYQERVEEEITKLPIKGTLPLVMTFAGLLICILTIPIVQVFDKTLKVDAPTIQKGF
jgi:pilus assembly protein TadC